jgi:outer membrane protein OmpA-like peptidoglycan-associated protein
MIQPSEGLDVMHRRLAIAMLLTLGACVMPAPGQRFVVFFTEFSAQLDEPAKGAISGAADWSKQHPMLEVHVVGFADPVGSPQANIDLSRLRAQVVSDALVASGVPVASIKREARGATSFTLTSQESRRVEITVGTP